MASGRGGHPDRRQDMPALARNRRGRRYPRYSGAVPPQCEGSKAVPAQADGPVRRPACRCHRQAARLHKANSRSCARGRPPGHRAHKGLNNQGPQQPRASTTGPGSLTVQRDGARKSWGGSSHPGRPGDFSPLTTGSTPSSSPAVTNFLQFPAATPAPTHFGCGMATPSK